MKFYGFEISIFNLIPAFTLGIVKIPFLLLGSTKFAVEPQK